MNDTAKTFTRAELRNALDAAFDAFDLTITPRARDDDEPDMEDITALANRIYDRHGDPSGRA